MRLSFSRVATTLLCVAAAAACDVTEAPSSRNERTPEPPTGGAATDIFVDVSERVGLDFVHVNGMTGEFYFNETMGAGGAVFDYDNDGDLDLYLIQGHMQGPHAPSSDARSPAGTGPLADRLFRNDLDIRADGSRTLRFTDVTEASGIDARGYGMGVSAADYNNDGWVDLYVTNFGSNQLLRNNQDGTFTDVIEVTGTDDARWSVSSAFLDYDRDGWLDLYVGNYLDFSLETNIDCFSNVRTYCGPDNYLPVPDRLFRNRGDDTFEDVTAVAQIREYGPALGVVTADFNADGWVDIYVANDFTENRCWINQGDGTFRNTALLGGSALNEVGDAEASMGVDTGDFDGDGDDDLFMTHLGTQTNTLYVNDGTGLFEDWSLRTGLGPPSLPYTGFGTAWVDYDNDSWLDLLVVNGAVAALERLTEAGDPYPLHQTNQLFRNLGNMRFDEVTHRAGAVFELSEVSRGAAFGDVDNDGDIDVLVTNNNGPARLLLNNLDNLDGGHHWIGLRLLGHTVNRDMLGARVGVFRDDGPPLWRRVKSDGSYASANDPRVLVGLGASERIAALRAIWPDGQIEEWHDVAIDQWTTLTEGSGRPPSE